MMLFCQEKHHFWASSLTVQAAPLITLAGKLNESELSGFAGKVTARKVTNKETPKNPEKCQKRHPFLTLF